MRLQKGVVISDCLRTQAIVWYKCWQYQKEYEEDSFISEIKELAYSVGTYFPDYLKSPYEYYEPLTQMEEKVFRLMAQGLSNDDIARQLGKKTGTVKFHSCNIFRKLQVPTRQEAVERGREIGLL